MVTETNPMKKTPAEKKAEKESFLASGPSNIDTLSALVKSQKEKAQTLRRAAEDAPEMARQDISALERNVSEQLYGMDPRQAAARGFEVQADFADQSARMRQAAADRQIQLAQQAFDQEQEALADERTAIEQVEEESTLAVTNAITLADNTIKKYLEAGQEWPMYTEAWGVSQTLTTPEEFEAYWNNIYQTYNQMGGDHTNPLSHPRVRLNLLLGNPPLQGVSPADTEEDASDRESYKIAQKELNDYLASQLPQAENEATTVTPA